MNHHSSRLKQCTKGENSHFGVTSQNIFSQSQKYFDTSITYFLKNILLQSNLQSSLKLKMPVATFETNSKDFIERKVQFCQTDT